MSKQLFRKASLDRVSSPEQLNEYIRVSNPGVWMLLSAIIILLIGVCVFGVVGNLDTTLSVAAVAEDGKVLAYVKESDISSIEEGMKVNIGDKECSIISISSEPVAVDASFSEYTLHVGSLQRGEWIYTVSLNGEVADGVYNALIVTESVSPISFVIN